MKKYQFRLTTLLKIRENVRDERRRALSEAYEAERIIEERKESTSQELNHLREQYRSAISPGTIPVDRLLESQRYEMMLRAFLKQIEEQHARLREEISNRRNALLLADREVKVLEKLREKEKSFFLAEESRRIIKEMDEIAQQRDLAKREADE